MSIAIERGVIAEWMQIARVEGSTQSPADRKKAANAAIACGAIFACLGGWFLLLQYAYASYGLETSGYVTSSSRTAARGRSITNYVFTTDKGQSQNGQEQGILEERGSAVTVRYLPFCPSFNRLSPSPRGLETRFYLLILAFGVLIFSMGVGARKKASKAPAM
jgi:hypothetical protein